MNADSQSEERLKNRFRTQTREAILEAAEATIAQAGVDAARMEDIAVAAGVAVGTVYNYFKDRRELVADLVEVRRAEIIARIDALLEDAELQTFDSRLRAFLFAIFAHFDQHRALFTLMVHEELDLTRHAQGRLSMIRGLTTRLDRLTHFGICSGALRSDGPPWAPLLLGLVRGVILQSLLENDQNALVDHVEPVAQFFMCGAQRVS